MHEAPDVIRDDPRIADLLCIDAPTPLEARGWLRQTGRATLHSGRAADVWRYGTESVAIIDLDGRPVETWGGCIVHQFGGWNVAR